MSQSENPQSQGSGRSSPDAQALVGLLESLVPLLLRFQSQTSSEPFQSGMAFQYYSANAPLQAAALDHQAAVTFTEDLLAGALRNVSTYLNKNSARHPALEQCNGLLAQATQAFIARDYGHAFALLSHIYRVVAAITHTRSATRARTGPEHQRRRALKGRQTMRRA
jgi:hypothetical protein